MSDRPLTSLCNELLATGLHRELRPRLAEAKRELPAMEDDAFATLLQVALVASRALSVAPMPNRRSGWLGGLVGLARSARYTARDIEGPFRTLERALFDGGAGYCRHFAWTVEAAFHLVQRREGRHLDARVVTLFGRDRFDTRWGHAWTLLVERDARAVVALDVTRAAQLARRPAELVDALDATAHNNTSAFVRGLFHRVGSPGLEVRDVQLLHRLTRDVVAADGPALLHRVARHGVGLGSELRRRIRAHLRERRFERIHPDWEREVESDRGPWDALFGVADEAAQAALLESAIR